MVVGIVPDEPAGQDYRSIIDDIVREGALCMLMAALEAEVDA